MLNATPLQLLNLHEMERDQWKPNVEICPPCPRCGSSNTKFCYYNNYSLTQPRYFCKGCRRYWTKGGSLRNIPVGGGCRKTRRARSIRVSDAINSHNFRARGDIDMTPGGGGVENRGGGDGGSIIMQPKNASIDIQQVYANFLNQRPQITHQELMNPGLHAEPEPMSSTFRFSSFPSMEMELGATNFGLNLESFISEGSGMQFCGYNSTFGGIHDGACGLPPLPGEELWWSPETNVEFPEHVLDRRIEPDGDVSGECLVKMFDMPASSGAVFRP